MDRVGRDGLKEFLAGRAEAFPDSKLPTIRELAARWNLGISSVQVVVREALQEGWIETRRGSGIWPRGAMPARESKPPRLDADRLAERIRERIESGGHAAGEPLPSPKDGAILHGVHPATVRKAYARLVARGWLERKGRSWKVRLPLAKGVGRPVVLCVGAARKDGSLYLESDREWDFWREVQLELVRCGLEPRILPVEETLSARLEECHGAIVSNWHFPETTRILDGLLRARLPAAVWSATEENLPGTRYRDARTLWFHNLAHGREAGEVMARHAVETGHRRIAWISPFHGSSWSVHRLEGLKRALGPDGEVVEAVHGWISEWDVHVTLAWEPSTLERFDLEGIDEPDLDLLRRPVVEALVRQECLRIFAPRLERALESGATLWVAGSDLVARWCLHWLSRRGIRVPRDLALASFDDTREATRLDLTSVRFPVQDMVRAMVRQILTSRGLHRRVSRYGGQLVARGSSRRRADRPVSPGPNPDG